MLVFLEIEIRTPMLEDNATPKATKKRRNLMLTLKFSYQTNFINTKMKSTITLAEKRDISKFKI